MIKLIELIKNLYQDILKGVHIMKEWNKHLYKKIKTYYTLLLEISLESYMWIKKLYIKNYESSKNVLNINPSKKERIFIRIHSAENKNTETKKKFFLIRNIDLIRNSDFSSIVASQFTYVERIIESCASLIEVFQEIDQVLKPGYKLTVIVNVSGVDVNETKFFVNIPSTELLNNESYKYWIYHTFMKRLQDTIIQYDLHHIETLTFKVEIFL